VSRRFLSAALLLSLIASDASAAPLLTLGCRPKPFGRILFQSIGLKAKMRIEVPSGGAEALRAALQPYAASHDLRFRTWGYDDQIRYVPPTMLVETKLQGVIIKIEVPKGRGTADIEVQTTCYADEEWQPQWRDLKDFVAESNYRILDLNEAPGTRIPIGSNAHILAIGAVSVPTIDVRLLSLPPLYPVKIQQ
jgi:hypothetical protein